MPTVRSDSSMDDKDLKSTWENVFDNIVQIPLWTIRTPGDMSHLGWWPSSDSSMDDKDPGDPGYGERSQCVQIPLWTIRTSSYRAT